MPSFLKYQEDEAFRQGNGRGPLYFGRARDDGMPFRGQAPLLREEEWDEYTQQTNDFGRGIFDWSIPEQARQLDEIMDKVVNGWYHVLDIDTRWHRKPDGTMTRVTAIMYGVPYRELDQGKAAAHLLPTPVPTFPRT